MSRTDHHRPYRIRIADPGTPRRYILHLCYVRGVPCDVDTTGVACGPALPYSATMEGPPSWYRRAVFSGPDRGRVAAWSRNTARYYNSGEENEEPPDGRHRHNGRWLWW
jgi:hypothetical protein